MLFIIFELMSRHILFFLLCLTLFSCRPETYVPKPVGYFLIETPQHAYRPFDKPGYPYSFEYPTYAEIERDTSFFGQKPENPYWININFPTIGGILYVSYKEINAKQTLGKLLEDEHQMSSYHSKKADYLSDGTFHNPNGVSGLYYKIGGDAASAYQFIATDSVKHFLRGALYFNVTPNADSLKPANDFIIKDIERMMYTMKWK